MSSIPKVSKATKITPGTEPPRNSIAEWAVTIVMLLFGTTTVAQAFVIPTGSMQDTLLIGDHLIVDKLAYAPPGPLTKHLLPYEDPKHGDIIVFRYPPEINTTLVKRLIGLPGDRLKIDHGVVYRNGIRLNEPYVYHKYGYRPMFDNFPGSCCLPVKEELAQRKAGHAGSERGRRRGRGSRQRVLCDG